MGLSKKWLHDQEALEAGRRGRKPGSEHGYVESPNMGSVSRTKPKPTPTPTPREDVKPLGKEDGGTKEWILHLNRVRVEDEWRELSPEDREQRWESLQAARKELWVAVRRDPEWREMVLRLTSDMLKETQLEKLHEQGIDYQAVHDLQAVYLMDAVLENSGEGTEES